MSSGSQAASPNTRVRIVVASSVMLTFISFWRAAAIVLNDLGSSAFYAGGIAEQAIGKAAPWFILGVMCFASLVRALYVESCSMFVRGGVYRVVKEALGGTFAKVSVSALMFDYILTGPISGVSAGHYIVGLINQLLRSADEHGWVPRAMHDLFQGSPQLHENWFAVLFAVAMTIFYWWQNTKGLEESSEKAMQVVKITSVMVVILLLWSALTMVKAPAGSISLPPWPTPDNLVFSEEALGWLKHTDWPHTIGLLGILIAFGHSVLAMSGEESLAQVNREIEHPKLPNLKKAAIVIGIFSFTFTGVASLLAVMLIPDAVRPQYYDNMISGLALHLVGPHWLTVLFSAFVVVVGFLMLSGAINTSIIGSNGVLNRISEDGVLHDWFRKPHKKYGTTYRLLNLVVAMQLLTIVASRGNVYTLGEAYAFGVIWSFTFNSVAMLVLRYKFKGARGWKMPPNIMIGNLEIPVGLLSVHIVLLLTALVNLFTKSIATQAGLVFTGTFFILFTLSERANRRKLAAAGHQMQEHFQLDHQEKIEREQVGIQPGNLLVTVRDYNTLGHLKWALESTNTEEQDVVVLSARLTGPGSSEFELADEQIFSDYEQTLFTKAVSVAEGVGKKISLLVVPARDPFSAIIQTANTLESSAIVAGLSSKMTAEEQAYRLGQAWEAMPEPKRQIIFQVVKPDDAGVETFRIGPHTPTMKTEDVHLVHRLWLRIRRHPGMEELHHSDIVTLSLTRLARDYGRDPEEIERALRKGEGLKTGSLAPATRPALTPPSLATVTVERKRDKRPDSASDPDIHDDKDTFQGF
ncbi:MAG TPA: APC family permease [Terriglobales bacterium]|nr:APC family permease [Terriglobales bacterium]